ncbi:hypothetical protein ACFQE1_03150 [Halobium palmae]|uniref:GAF domain-containing protein n=1 Tax=Halobium palmae TaxID=1776492 RepID=A0ABD5RW19_9EURY
MTRSHTVVERFEHGELLKTAPAQRYRDHGGMHAYYVPNAVRQLAGTKHLDSLENYRKENRTVDWASVREQIPSTTLVDEVDTETPNGVGGNVGRERSLMLGEVDSADTEPTAPRGVVKFTDPNIHESETQRDPLVRGYCWAAVQDEILGNTRMTEVPYLNELESTQTAFARVPMFVTKEGAGVVAAYLIAHDHSNAQVGLYVNRPASLIGKMVQALEGRSETQ